MDECFIFPPEVGERLDHDEGIEGWVSKREWIQRIYAVVARIEQVDSTHKTIVAHGGSAGWVIVAWVGIPIETCTFAAFRTPTGSVSVVEQDDRFHNRLLVRFGATAL